MPHLEPGGVADQRAGREVPGLDAALEVGVVAAGALICEAAGLEVRHLEPAPPMDAGILVAPPALADELASLVD